MLLYMRRIYCFCHCELYLTVHLSSKKGTLDYLITVVISLTTISVSLTISLITTVVCVPTVTFDEDLAFILSLKSLFSCCKDAISSFNLQIMFLSLDSEVNKRKFVLLRCVVTSVYTPCMGLNYFHYLQKLVPAQVSICSLASSGCEESSFELSYSKVINLASIFFKRSSLLKNDSSLVGLFHVD